MFITGGNVELSMEVGEGPTHGFKLVVGMDDGNPEPTGNTCANESLEVLYYMAVFHIVEFTS